MATSPPIGQALADDLGCGLLHAGNIVHAYGDTVAVAEVKFGKVAVQMLLAAMLVNALCSSAA